MFLLLEDRVLVYLKNLWGDYNRFKKCTLMNSKRTNIPSDSTYYGIPFIIKDFNGMPFRSLGNSGLKVPNVGLGTWKMGYPEMNDGSRVGEDAARKIFDLALELGVVLWDTANRYNNASGNSERIIGKWFQENPSQRRNITLATKLSGGMDGLTPNHCGLSRTNILESLYASLERLQADYIDILYFHSFDETTSIDESLAAIEDLVRQDLVRYFAVSNFDINQINEYLSYGSNFSVRSRMVAVQNKFDILDGEDPAYQGVLKSSEDNGVSFVAWSPLGKGLLTDRYTDLSRVGRGDRLFDENLIDTITPRQKKCLNDLSSLANEWGMRLNELAISYMLTLPGMGPIIPSSSSLEQLRSNALGGKLILSEEQRMRIMTILK